jgi:hypothetical protein
MKSADQDEDPLVLIEDELAQLHLEIAKRADEIAARRGGARDPQSSLECWLQAENEVLTEPRTVTA